MDLNVIYEDNHIIVVVKPVGVPSQADKTGDIDMITIVKGYLREKYEKKGNVYLGLVHRLDRMVGGVMVFAKTSKASSRISEYIRNKDMKKKYFAIVNGKMEIKKEYITLENFLVKNERINMSRVVTDKNIKNAKLAILEYKVIKNIIYNNKDYSIIDIKLHTGRHHQIRLQFANIGYPLYGDQKYGQKINKIGQNVGLFSYYLEFPHPTKDEICKFEIMPYEVKKHDKIWEDLK